MICDHGMPRRTCAECRTDADRDTNDRLLVDDAAATFRANPGKYDVVGVDAFNCKDAAAILAYAKARHPDVPFARRSLVVEV
jgi:spermidine synthase